MEWYPALRRRTELVPYRGLADIKLDFLAKRFSYDFVLNAKNRSQRGTQNDAWSAGY